MYELQLFDDTSGQYVPVETGDDPESLMNQARGMARRVISLMRGHNDVLNRPYDKPLPLKPRIPYGLSGKPRKYRPDTMIEPPHESTLAERAESYYRKRAETEVLPVDVYVWRNTKFASSLRLHLAKYQPKDSEAVFRFIELDPDEYL